MIKRGHSTSKNKESSIRTCCPMGVASLLQPRGGSTLSRFVFLFLFIFAKRSWSCHSYLFLSLSNSFSSFLVTSLIHLFPSFRQTHKYDHRCFSHMSLELRWNPEISFYRLSKALSSLTSTCGSNRRCPEISSFPQLFSGVFWWEKCPSYNLIFCHEIYNTL